MFSHTGKNTVDLIRRCIGRNMNLQINVYRRGRRSGNSRHNGSICINGWHRGCRNRIGTIISQNTFLRLICLGFFGGCRGLCNISVCFNLTAFQHKDRGSFSVAPQEFARGRETPWLGRFAGLAFFNVSMKAGGRPQDLPVRCSTGGSTESGTERCGIARRRRTPGWRSCSSRGSRRCSSGP